MELEEPTERFEPIRDTRPHMPMPPPVRIVAIDDVRLTTPAGLEAELDALYVGLLQFERDEPEEGAPIVYRAENGRVLVSVTESPERDDYRPLQVEIPHFEDFVRALNDREIEYELQRGLAAGTDAVLFRDPAGNWVSVTWQKKVGMP